MKTLIQRNNLPKVILKQVSHQLEALVQNPWVGIR